jgi:hypothetical protein
MTNTENLTQVFPRDSYETLGQAWKLAYDRAQSIKASLPDRQWDFVEADTYRRYVALVETLSVAPIEPGRVRAVVHGPDVVLWGYVAAEALDGFEIPGIPFDEEGVMIEAIGGWPGVFDLLYPTS